MREPSLEGFVDFVGGAFVGFEGFPHGVVDLGFCDGEPVGEHDDAGGGGGGDSEDFAAVLLRHGKDDVGGVEEGVGDGARSV